MKLKYVNFLIDKLKFEDKRKLNKELFKKLNEKEFEGLKETARLSDAIRIRYQFIDQNLAVDFYIPYVTILEVFTTFAVKIDNDWLDLGPSIIFSEMLWNLGLDPYSSKGLDKFDEIIDRFNKKDYDLYGNGGCFPLKKLIKGKVYQKDLGLYNQCINYINENRERLIG